MSKSLLLDSNQIKAFNAVSNMSIEYFNTLFQTIAVITVLIGAIAVICLLVYQNADGQISVMSMIMGVAGTFMFIGLFTIFLI
jgi:hypothetical protein